jgi:MFS family permease
MGQQIMMVAAQFLVLDHSDSRSLMGLAVSLQSVPVILLTPIAGVITDRASRRSLLIFGMVGLLALNLLLGMLVAGDAFRIWQVMVWALMVGVAMAFTQPATQAFIYDIVGRERLLNAIALNAAASSIFRLSGPALAGAVAAAIGTVGVFFAGGGLYSLAVLLMLPITVTGRSLLQKREPFLREVVEGVKIMKSNATVRWLLLFTGGSLLVSSRFALRPVFAEDVLDVGKTGFTIWAIVGGVGSLLGSIVIAAWGRKVKRQALMVVFAGMTVFAMMVVFAFSRSFVLSTVTEFISGFASIFWMTPVMSILQTAVAEEMRGRVMALFFLFLQGSFQGHLLAGGLADVIGETWTLGSFGMIMFSWYVYVLLFVKPITHYGKEPVLKAGAH